MKAFRTLVLFGVVVLGAAAIWFDNWHFAALAVSWLGLALMSEGAP